MALTANIYINGLAGSQVNLVIGSLVTLTNVSATPPTSYLWAILSQPEGTAVSLSSTTSPTPTFTATKEGSYLISLVVSDGVTTATQKVVAAVAELETGNRIPAAGETLEVDAADGWSNTAADRILQRVTRLTDGGVLVAQLAQAGVVAGEVVEVQGNTTIGGPSNTRVVPNVVRTTASTISNVRGLLGVLVSNVAGSTTPVLNDLVRVMYVGLYQSLPIGVSPTPTVNDFVYVNDAGNLSLTAGTNIRIVGTVSAVGATTYDAFINGASTGGILAGAAGGVLGYPGSTYPNPSGLAAIANVIPIASSGAGTTITMRVDATASGAGAALALIAAQGSTVGGAIGVTAGRGLGGLGGAANVTAGRGSTNGGAAGVTGGQGSSVGGAAAVTGGLGSATGGAASLTGGVGGSGLGGAANVTGGGGGGGGAARLRGGDATGAGSGGLAAVSGGGGVLAGGNASLSGGQASAGTGGTATVVGGTGNVGGNASVTGGAGATGVGGDAKLTGGASSAGEGAQIVSAGASLTEGGGVALLGGLGPIGGGVLIRGGQGDTTVGGDVTIAAGVSGSGVGGAASLSGGESADADGGAATVIGGAASALGGYSGAVEIDAGEATGSAVAGNVEVGRTNAQEVLLGRTGKNVETFGRNVEVAYPLSPTAATTIAVNAPTIMLANTGAVGLLGAHPNVQTSGIAEGTVVTFVQRAAGSTTFWSELGDAGSALRLDGAASKTLSQYDTLTLVYTGTYWVQVGYSNNF